MNFDRRYVLEDIAKDMAALLVDDKVTLAEFGYVIAVLKDLLGVTVVSENRRNHIHHIFDVDRMDSVFKECDDVEDTCAETKHNA